MVGYNLSKNHWVKPFLVIFRFVRDILLVTVAFDHPVSMMHVSMMHVSMMQVSIMHVSTMQVCRMQVCIYDAMYVWMCDGRQKKGRTDERTESWILGVGCVELNSVCKIIHCVWSDTLLKLHIFCQGTHFVRTISKQFLSRTNWKILHLTDLFTQPAVVMVVTSIRCASGNVQAVRSHHTSKDKKIKWLWSRLVKQCSPDFLFQLCQVEGGGGG